MRPTIFSLLAVTTIAAAYVALGGDAIFFWLLAYAALGLCLLIFLYCYVAHPLANACVPRLVAWGQPWLARRLFGYHLAALALNSHAVGRMNAGRLEEASDLLDLALNFEERDPVLWTNYADCLYRLQRYDAAIENATIALQLDDEAPRALELRGFAHLCLEQNRLALHDLQQVKCTKVIHYDCAYHRGYLYQLNGQWPQALSDYLLASHLDASRLEAAMLVISIQAACPVAEMRCGAKAVENATTLCQRTGWKDWLTISLLAAAYAEQGDFQLAIKYATEAHDLAPAEHKAERLVRIEQYRQHQPYRL